jgi:hypothetical protein
MSVPVREVTVKTISMAMGIRRPGFQLLSIKAPTSSQNAIQTLSHQPCLLPNQLSIYLSIYIPLCALSLLILLLSNIHRTRTAHRRHAIRAYSPPEEDSDIVFVPSAPPESRNFRLRLDTENDIEGQWTHLTSSDEEESSPYSLLPPSSSTLHSGKLPPRSAAPMLWSFVLFGRRRHLRMPPACCSITQGLVACFPGGRGLSKWTGIRHGPAASGFLYDIRDVAVVPLGLFTLISCWMLLQ